MTQADLEPGIDTETRTRPRAGRRGKTLTIAGIAMAATLIAGVVPRLQGREALRQHTDDAMTPIVSVVHPRPAPAAHDITLPGDVRAYQDAAIHSRVNGYLRRWYFDIGATVRQGDLLAEIDAPEVADQLRQARADEASAAANYALAKSTAARWQDLQATHSVAQQETDQKVADMRAKAALLASAQSNTSRLAQLASYTQIRAPFDGVITARNVDAGALVDAGSGTNPGRELFHLSAGSRLRVYVQVPQDASAKVARGTQAWLTLPQAPGQRFPAAVARTSGAIDPVTRTLRVELDVDSRGGHILPGAYAEVHLDADTTQAGFDLPAATLLFRPQGPCVAVVGTDGKLAIQRVTLGRDFGSHVEVLDGIAASDAVVVNPGDGLVAGAPVRVVPAQGGAA